MSGSFIPRFDIFQLSRLVDLPNMVITFYPISHKMGCAIHLINIILYISTCITLFGLFIFLDMDCTRL